MNHLHEFETYYLVSDLPETERMNHPPGTGRDTQEAANGVDTPESPECRHGQHSLATQPLKCAEKLLCIGADLMMVSPGGVLNYEGELDGGSPPHRGGHTGTANTGTCHTEVSHAFVPDTRPIETLYRSVSHTDTPHDTVDDDPNCSFSEKDLRGEGEGEEGQEETVGAHEHSADSDTAFAPATGNQLPPDAPPAEKDSFHRPPHSQEPPCPPHVMAQVRVRNAPYRERIVRGMQDSKSLEEISQVCGGMRGRGGQPEGRRATISSALELEGTVSHDGDLTHFITRNLEHKIKMSSRPSLDCDSHCSAQNQGLFAEGSGRSRGSLRRPADIPPIDPSVLVDLQKEAQGVAQSVELMMRSLSGTIQNMTALSVGYIQTYRDSVDSVGEAVDMSIKGMYTLMARCEELDRSMQPIHTLAKQIRDIKRTLDTLETLCK